MPGSVTLIGGDPGIGTSTLILQLLASLADRGHGALYVTGEESVRQIRMRAGRLGIEGQAISISTENCVEAIVELAGRLRPALQAVDSIQTMYSEEVASAPGSVTQVREATARLLQLAKSTHLPILLVGLSLPKASPPSAGGRGPPHHREETGRGCRCQMGMLR